ncbi:hypothetical protein PO124_14980 [Bacillus licheniformis]|nr:hypothetical protein [Bacillus licheniformis]
MGSVAGIVSVVPYMMRVLFSLNADTIGSGILLPGTVGVIFSALRAEPLQIASAAGLFYSWMVIDLVNHGSRVTGRRPDTMVDDDYARVYIWRSFICETAISNSTAESLEEKAAGAGMGMLNFACFYLKE